MAKTTKIGQKNDQKRQKMTKIVKNIANKTGSGQNRPKVIKSLIFECQSKNQSLIDDSWSYHHHCIKIKARKSYKAYQGESAQKVLIFADFSKKSDDVIIFLNFFFLECLSFINVYHHAKFHDICIKTG